MKPALVPLLDCAGLLSLVCVAGFLAVRSALENGAIGDPMPVARVLVQNDTSESIDVEFWMLQTQDGGSWDGVAQVAANGGYNNGSGERTVTLTPGEQRSTVFSHWEMVRAFAGNKLVSCQSYQFDVAIRSSSTERVVIIDSDLDCDAAWQTRLKVNA